jgi:hypothetical protein
LGASDIKAVNEEAFNIKTTANEGASDIKTAANEEASDIIATNGKNLVDGNESTTGNVTESRSADQSARGLNLKLNLDQIAEAGAELAGLMEQERWSALPSIRTPKGQ